MQSLCQTVPREATSSQFEAPSEAPSCLSTVEWGRRGTHSPDTLNESKYSSFTIAVMKEERPQANGEGFLSNCKLHLIQIDDNFVSNSRSNIRGYGNVAYTA